MDRMLGSSNSHDFIFPLEMSSCPPTPAMPYSIPPEYSQWVPDLVTPIMPSGGTSFLSPHMTREELKSYVRTVISELVVTPNARSIIDYYKLPPVYFPPGFKVPKYRKYDGTSDPRQHFSSFLMDSHQFMHDKALLVHLFQGSFEGEALMWFASLSASELTSFRTVIEIFIARFDPLTCQALTLFNLANEKMSRDEDFFVYANRWWIIASRSGIAIPETQAVTMIINNATPQLRAILILSKIHTIS